jgi:hypothetical protein
VLPLSGITVVTYETNIRVIEDSLLRQMTLPSQVMLFPTGDSKYKAQTFSFRDMLAVHNTLVGKNLPSSMLFPIGNVK